MQDGLSQLHLVIKGTGRCRAAAHPGLLFSCGGRFDFQVQSLVRFPVSENVANALTGGSMPPLVTVYSDSWESVRRRKFSTSCSF